MDHDVVGSPFKAHGNPQVYLSYFKFMITPDRPFQEILNFSFVPDDAARELARRTWDQLTKPQGSLGRLEDLVEWLAGVLGYVPRTLERKSVVVFASDHGVAAEGVSAYPQEVTAQMVRNFARGGAAINVLSRVAGADLLAVDVGVAAEYEAPGAWRRPLGRGTGNIARGPAMTREQAMQGIRIGLEVAEAKAAGTCQVLALGDMGIGNTTASSAVVAALTGLDPDRVTGRGTGLDEAARQRKVDVVRRALAVNRPNPDDPLDVLAKVGGFEIAGLVGAILGSARARVPVILDGFIVGVAALLAVRLKSDVRGCLLASHRSAEPGHTAVLEGLGLDPLFDLALRLGEGTGAVLAFLMLDAAIALWNGMATFDDASVSRALREGT